VKTPADLLPSVIDIAHRAGALLRTGFGGVIDSTAKEGRHNLVTEYDLAVERLLYEALQEIAPGSAFLGEEGGLHAGTSEVEWIVDPLDGTVNFAHGIPIFCVSIAARIQGEMALGVIHQPLLDETFAATRGGGAHLNGVPIRVSDTPQLSDSILVTGFPYNVHTNPQGCIDQFAKVVRTGLPIRRLGSAALDLAYIAAGRFDGYWEVELQPWDMAAGSLLVQEAGGHVTHYGGRPLVIGPDSIVASNGKIHSDLVQLLELQESS